MTDSLGFIVAAILTLCVFSYLLGDNVLYRLAEHLFVAVALGYACVVVLHQVLWAKLFAPMGAALGDGDMGRVLLLLVPLVLGLLLLFKSSRRAGPLSWFGSLSLAFLLGVGAAVAIAGGLLGTLLPQIGGASDVARYVTRYGPVLGLLSGIVAVVGTIGVLFYFYFGSGEGRFAHLRNSVVRVWGGLGSWFVLIAFGALLATIFLSRLPLLMGRIEFLIDGLRGGG
ncbi:MAG: hypothetical protein JXM73_03950 [Anaerolineae bacterium]|nr:hypothetical protein [Anaerolineae bacterium]